MVRATAIFSFLVLLMAAGAVLAQAVVPVRAIRGQSLISAEDLEIGDIDVPGAVTEIAAAAGLEARVTLYPGRPVMKSQIGAPALVERNQVVRMAFVEGGLSITTEGRVLDRAGVGESVRVMNLASRQIVSGTVAADGSIEVGTR